jgi:hypothetical protein
MLRIMALVKEFQEIAESEVLDHLQHYLAHPRTVINVPDGIPSCPRDELVDHSPYEKMTCDPPVSIYGNLIRAGINMTKHKSIIHGPRPEPSECKTPTLACHECISDMKRYGSMPSKAPVDSCRNQVVVCDYKDKENACTRCKAANVYCQARSKNDVMNSKIEELYNDHHTHRKPIVSNSCTISRVID